MPRTAPDFTWPRIAVTVSKIIAVRPASRSGCAAELPLYGTCCILVPVMLMKSSAAMCSELPGPLDA